LTGSPSNDRESLRVAEVPRGRPWFYPLARREAEAIELLADGLSVDEISRKMTVRRDALQVHIRSCTQKLGFRTRSELVDWFVKNRPRTRTRE